MHRKRGIDRGTEVIEGSWVWGEYLCGVWGAPSSGKVTTYVPPTHYCRLLPLIFGIWFGVRLSMEACCLSRPPWSFQSVLPVHGPIQLQSATRRPDCVLSE